MLPIFVLRWACWRCGTAVVSAFAIPPYVLPGPGLVFPRSLSDGALLWQSLWVTLSITFEGFLLAAVGGVGLAIAFNQSRVFEYSLYPYAVILQVTPVVAIAPLLLIYLPQPRAVLACAWIVAFFPVLANTTLGLNSVDHNLLALFELYKASRWQVLWYLKLPAALPQMLAGLRIAGGLSLIGAVVAEIAAGSAGAGSGLAYRIAESGYRLNIPRMFAALLLLSLAGVAIFFALSALSHLALRRWHESELRASASASSGNRSSCACKFTALPICCTCASTPPAAKASLASNQGGTMTNKIDLSGRKAVVTGGAQGIGRAIAERFLDSGAAVALWDRDLALAAKTAAALAERAAMCAPIAADVTDYESRRARARGHAEGVRPHRHPGQQCRHRRAQRRRPPTIRWRPGARSWRSISTGRSIAAAPSRR